MIYEGKNSTPLSLRATIWSAAIPGISNTILSCIALLLSRLAITKINPLKRKYQNKMKDLGVLLIKTMFYMGNRVAKNKDKKTNWKHHFSSIKSICWKDIKMTVNRHNPMIKIIT